MQDINYQLRQSYYALLNGVAPVHYNELPAGSSENAYILINSITSSGFNSWCNNMTNTTVQLIIVTKNYQNNSGALCDSLAGQVLDIILPDPRAKAVQITDGQVINTTLALDVPRTGLTDGVKKVVQRIISFQHMISVN